MANLSKKRQLKYKNKYDKNRAVGCILGCFIVIYNCSIYRRKYDQAEFLHYF